MLRPVVLVLALLANHVYAARDMSDAEFLQCNDLLEQVMAENAAHERKFSTPVDNLNKSLVHVSGTLLAIDSELQSALAADSERLRQTQKLLQQFQQTLELRLELVEQQLQNNKQQLISVQVDFRKSCLSGIKVPNSVYAHFCPTKDSLPLCGIFK